MILKNVSVALFCLALGACATSPTENTAPAAAATVCEDPRPQVCTMDYRPVCANLGTARPEAWLRYWLG